MICLRGSQLAWLLEKSDGCEKSKGQQVSKDATLLGKRLLSQLQLHGQFVKSSKKVVAKFKMRDVCNKNKKEEGNRSEDV